jgi:superfamily II DNA or RNA helicase
MEEINLEPLYSEKQEVLLKINEYFVNNRMGYIKVPTGWGKTFLAKHLIKKYYEDEKIILFLVSRNNQLLNQTFYRDENRTRPLFPSSLILSSEHDRISAEMLKRKINSRDGGIVIFISLQTILSKKNKEIKDILSKNADLVIIDEIHNFIQNKGNAFINEINENARILGMTATPFQGVIGAVKFVDDISSDMFEIYSKTLPQCIIDGQLSELSYTIIRTNQNILDIFSFEKGLSELDKETLFLDCSTLERINLLVQRTYLAKKVYDEKIKSKNTKTLIFCAPVRNIVYGFGDSEKKVNAFHAKLCSAIFNSELKDKFDPSISFNNYSELGQLKYAVYLSSELPEKERNAILEAFKTLDKPPFVLCTVGMLIEGFDFPDLENLMLLRPTLSMRLFEQQVGRVTRLARKSNKNRGNIFEIVDDIDSLYDNFGEAVFREKNIERIQRLQPENRIEELFTEGNTTEAINTGKIQISEINFKGIVEGFQENSVQIPPTSLRVKHFCKLLSIIEEKDIGEFEIEKEKLMAMAIRFKVHNIEDAKEITKLITLLEKLEKEACEEKRQVFHEVKWLLKLRALTYMKFNSNLSFDDKNTILKIIALEGDFNKIDDYRIKCFKKGCAIDINRLIKLLRAFRSLTKLGLRLHKIKRKILPYVYWASCFTIDHPELKELFESKEWNYNIRKYILKQK